MTTPGVGASPDASRDSSAEGGGLTTARDVSIAARRRRGHTEGARAVRHPGGTGGSVSTTQRPRIGLALGSGGARGLAHIGVIERLEEHGVPIDFIAGSSIGALIGALYASGTDGAGLRRIASDTTWARIVSLFDPSLRHGLLKGVKLERFIQQNVGGLRLEGCSIPLAVVATDVRSGEAVVFQRGDLSAAVRASVSVPGVFRPVGLDGRLLADGGLSIPVPAEPVRNMGADVVLAVDLDSERPLSDPSDEREPGARATAYLSIALLRRHLAAQDARDADVIVRPRFGREIHWDGFLDPYELIDRGREAMDAQMTALDTAVAAGDEDTGGALHGSIHPRRLRLWSRPSRADRHPPASQRTDICGLNARTVAAVAGGGPDAPPLSRPPSRPRTPCGEQLSRSRAPGAASRESASARGGRPACRWCVGRGLA